jgi:threonyl-tRNA synthetase
VCFFAHTSDRARGIAPAPRAPPAHALQDAIGRKWQCSTIQLDFNLPERFGMEYTTPENTKERPIMIHRAILGSIERFFGVLTENYAGAFPLWLAPEQVRLLPVNADAEEFCRGVLERLKAARVRATMVRRHRRRRRAVHDTVRA